MLRSFLLAIVALLGAVAGPASAALSAATARQIDAKIADTLAAFGAPSVSVAIVADGVLAYAKAFGEADLARHRQATTATRYAVGSISKQFTVAALLLAQEQGKLSLDDKVSKYFPELTRAGEISIRQLVSHTSGYEDFGPQDYIIPDWTKPTTADAILAKWAKKPLNFDPGTRWQYSNTNYTVAGRIFEKATGQDLLVFLHQQILDPLGMASAGDCEVANPADATAYTRFALGPPRLVAREGPGWYFAAGELCMTPSDLSKWNLAFLQKRILSPASYAEFTREMKLNNGNPTHYALGLSVGEVQGIPSLSHGGEVSGFLALNTLIPSKGIAIAVLSNEDGVSMIGTVSREIAATLLGKTSPAAEALDAQVRGILAGLAEGKIDRALFTSNANQYFTTAALDDYRNSLSPLGKLLIVSRQNEQLRGGMTHYTYRAHFQRDTIILNIYVMPDGKFEQFMAEETF